MEWSDAGVEDYSDTGHGQGLAPNVFFAQYYYAAPKNVGPKVSIYGFQANFLVI